MAHAQVVTDGDRNALAGVIDLRRNASDGAPKPAEHLAGEWGHANRGGVGSMPFVGSDPKGADRDHRQAFKAALRASVGGSFTKMKLEIKDLVAGDDKVVARFTNSGVNSDRPATGRYALWEGIGIYRLRDGKIAEANFCEDLYGQLKMLGRNETCS